jgi:FdhD protein
MLKIKIVRVDVAAGETRKMIDYVAEEKPLHISVNKKHYTTIFCSPSNLKELAVGHLLSGGIIESIEEIEEISFMKNSIYRVGLKPNIDLQKRLKLQKPFSRIILSTRDSPSPYQIMARLPKVRSGLTVEAQVILSCVNRLNSIAETFRKTGGVHAAAIYKSNGNLVAFAEDIGRHNTVDKVIGMGALSKTAFSECLIALTGRLTGEIVRKTARVGLPVVVSLAAATDSGIAVAKDVGLTLIGFVRRRRMNIYNFPERILSSP